MAIEDFVNNKIHEETQKTERGFDLTVDEIHEVVSSGRVDFGGGELEESETRPHEKQKRNPDDDYSWWHLDRGQYLVEYNEELTKLDDEGLVAVVQTRQEVLERGAFHPTLHVKELPKIPLRVSGSGIKIKENARVSTMSIDRGERQR